MTKTFPKAVAAIALGTGSLANAQHNGVHSARIGQDWFGGAMVHGMDHMNW